MWKSSIPAFLHMKPVDSVPTHSGCRAPPPDHAELEHRRKLCVGTTPFAWLIKKDSARNEQGKPILGGPASVLPSPPPQKASQRRFLLAMTGKTRPVGTTVVLRCRSLRERMTARVKGGHRLQRGAYADLLYWRRYPQFSNCLRTRPVQAEMACTRPYSTPLHTAKLPI